MSSELPLPDFVLNRMNDQQRQMFTVMTQEDGIAKMLLQPVYGDDGEGNPTTSQAEVVADMFNIMRLDIQRTGEAVGADIEVKRMTPAKAAEMLQGLVKGQSFELITKFNELEDKRESVLAELVEEDEIEVHQETKKRLLYSSFAEEPSEEEAVDMTDGPPEEGEAEDGEDQPEEPAEGGEDDAA